MITLNKETNMNKILLAAFAIATLCCSAYAAVTVPVAGVVRATAHGDLISTELPYAAKIVGVKVNPVTSGKYYRLIHPTTSAIIYENFGATTTGTMTLDTVSFTKPSAGLRYQTNDTGAITIYTEQ